MSYLGRGLEQVDNISKLDNITFNGGTTYALTKDSAAFTPISSNALLVSIDGVIQQGNFSVSGTNIVFNFSPTGSNTCDFIMHYGTGVAFTPADSSVTKDKANFISTSSSAGLQIKGDGTTDGTLQLNCSQNSHGVKIKSPAHSASQSYTLTLPTTAPASNKILQTDGSGNLSFVDAPSGTLVELGQSSVAAGSSVTGLEFSNIFSSSYNTYFVRVSKIRFVGNTNLRLRFYTDTGTTEQSLTYYLYVQYGLDASGNEERTHSNASSYIQMSQTIDYDQPSDGGITGFFYIDNPLANSSFSVTAYGQMCYRNDANVWNGLNFNGKFSGSSPRYGFKLYGSSNVEYADVTVYGVKP